MIIFQRIPKNFGLTRTSAVCLKKTGLSGTSPNFGLRQHGNSWCRNAWHGKCYVQHKLDDFPVLGQQDLDALLIDESFLEDDDPKRFQEGRDGDHLMCLFQCEDCHFINIQGRVPNPDSPYDVILLCCMRRENLDSFWSRERSTVYSNLLEGKGFLATQQLLGIDTSSLPPREQFPKRDVMGMGVAASFLLRSKAKGKARTPFSFKR
jgi:hypothetical protein